ncbi:hypothetical protein BaRGS_00017238 [Batillaria attramentaria]|uniref:Uncharacterized protein n=1 Tax=Batillaria attramentaria TaxID=370345 RepID=A0ABD0KWT8_9CAEN
MNPCVCLFAENCELDTKFIESATRDTANFQHFLDDVINDADVPADDILLGLLDDSSTQHVPTKSSSLHALSTPGGSLFSCARGSTETRLCSSVPLLASSPGFVFSTASPPGGQSGLQSQTSPIPASSGLLTSSSCLPIVTSSLSSLSQAASLADVMSYTDSVLSEDKIKDLLDWLAVGNSCSSLTDTALELGGHGGSSALEASPIEEKCDLGRQVQPEYCNSCSSVSVSHQIENGVCLLCSAAKRPIKDSDKLGQPLTFSGALSSRGAVPVSQFYKGNDSDTTVTSPAVKAAGGKRKSVCDDNTDNDNAEGCKRAKIDSSHDKKTEAVIDDSSDSARPQGRVHSAKREQTQSQTDDNNNTTTCVFDKAELKVDTSDMLGFLSNLTAGLPTDARWRSW